MITENAPPIFLFYMDETLSVEERKELLELNAKAKLEPEEIERIDTLTSKYYDLRSTTPIPVPVVGELIGMIPEGYKQSMVKSIDMAGGVPVLKGNVNTATVTLKSSSNDFINAMMGIASWFFAKDDALPRVCFFSPEMVIIGGTLLNMTRANKADSTEQVLTLEMQKGDKSILGDNSNTQSPTNIPKTVEVVK